MKDQISALVDGEVSLDDIEHVYKAIKAGGVASESWTQYHLIGDVMRSAPVFRQDFTTRLMQKLEQEPAVLAPKSSVISADRSARSSSAWSVAASVAAVMFVGWMVLQQQVQNGVSANNVQIAQAEVNAKVDVNKNIPSEYLLAHQSYAPSNSAYIQPAAYSESVK